MDRHAVFVASLVLFLAAAACGGADVASSSATTSTLGATTTSAGTTAPSVTTTSDASFLPFVTTAPPTITTTTMAAISDSEPPVLVVTAPQPGTTVAVPTFRFAGFTDPGCSVTAAGGYAADVDADGNWSIELMLDPGGNVATFVATDPEGNTTTATASVTYEPPPRVDGTVLVVDEEGVYQIDAGGRQTTLVQGAVVSAVDDARGGLLFQTHSGRNWNGEEAWSTIVWWIPRGSSTPQELLVPDPSTDHELTLHDAMWTADGFVVIYTRHEGYTPFEHPPTMSDRLRAFDVDTHQISDLYRVRGWEWNVYDASAGGGLVTATEWQMTGGGCILLDDEGRTMTRPGVPTPSGCFEEENGGCPHSCTLSDDGARAAYIEPREDLPWGGAVIVVRETATGAEVGGFDLPEDAPGPPYEAIGELWVEGSHLVANRWEDHRWDLGNYLRALVFDLDRPGEGPHTLSIPGRARLVARAVDIGGPVRVDD